MEKKLITKVKRLHKLNTRKKRLDAELKEINKKVAGWYDKGTGVYHKGLAEVVGDEMVKGGFQSFRIEGIGLVFRVESSSPKVEDEDKMKAWLVGNGRADIIKQTVNFMSLKSLCNELADAFKPYPDGVKITTSTVARIRKG
jgi:hypothetical protein